METYQSTTHINGLGDDIYSAMMQNAQTKIIEKILTAARNGRTDCVIKSKGLTPTFLSQLETEGVSNHVNDEGHVILFWEW